MNTYLRRFLLVIAGITAVSGVGIAVMFVYGYYFNTYLPAQVELNVRHIANAEPAKKPWERYNRSSCTAEHPIAVTITNKSLKTVEQTTFRIEIRKEGYSRNLTTEKYLFISDKILKPGEPHTMCIIEPETQNHPIAEGSKIIYEAKDKKVRFQ